MLRPFYFSPCLPQATRMRSSSRFGKSFEASQLNATYKEACGQLSIGFTVYAGESRSSPSYYQCLGRSSEHRFFLMFHRTLYIFVGYINLHRSGHRRSHSTFRKIVFRQDNLYRRGPTRSALEGISALFKIIRLHATSSL